MDIRQTSSFLLQPSLFSTSFFLLNKSDLGFQLESADLYIIEWKPIPFWARVVSLYCLSIVSSFLSLFRHAQVQPPWRLPRWFLDFYVVFFRFREFGVWSSTIEMGMFGLNKFAQIWNQEKHDFRLTNKIYRSWHKNDVDWHKFS